MSSRNATRRDFDHVMDCIGKGLINPALFITARVKFESVKECFDSWLDPGSGLIKAMVELED
jgi:threonine dehydrogenase-like Zn-dependent dehydrogenase